jgi:hypothetical protein
MRLECIERGENVTSLTIPWGTEQWTGSSSDRLPPGPCLSDGPVEVVKHLVKHKQ